MITKLYRKLPIDLRNKIYKLFLGRLLQLIRQPQIVLEYFKDRENRKLLLSFLSLFKDKEGLEIGGGTFFFSIPKGFPVYQYAASIDGCNFSTETIWEGNINEKIFSYKGQSLGTQFICEATQVDKHIRKHYDFIISSNCLEHIANPLKAIKSWLQVLKDNGVMLIILPNKQSNFDNRRDYTSFSHLCEDYNKDVAEDDMTHFDEIVSLHDLKRDSIRNREQFVERSKDNFKNRCFHHHVFSESLLIEIFRFFNINTLYSGKDFNNIYIVGIKNGRIVK